MIRPTRKRLLIVGAGPIGLEAAARASQTHLDVTVCERREVGANIQSWGHVTLFSPFSMNRSDIGLSIVENSDARDRLPRPDDYLTGEAYVDRYLAPLAKAIGTRCRILKHTKVVAIGRRGLLKHEKIGDPTRGDAPFRVLLQNVDGDRRVQHVDLVIDASGVYGNHRALGDGGIPAPGEHRAADVISYELDDIAGAHRERYAQKRVLLIGAGYSAATSAIALKTLQNRYPETRAVWVVRRQCARPIQSFENDPLPERQRISDAANAIAANPTPEFEFHSGLVVDALDMRDDGSVAVSAVDVRGNATEFIVDRIVSNTGYVPDRSLYRELQVHECWATSGPMKLAATLLDQPPADCLEQRSPGLETLFNPEPNFYILGGKSYGRNSSFLIRVGLEQIDQLFGSIADQQP